MVVVDKSAGMTSHDVVYHARKLYRTKRVGHTGTLDPDATGVLVLCLGQATRLAEYLSASRKNYIAEVVFGIETDSQDASGQITSERDASRLTEETLLALLPSFRGTIEQVPPMVSALHHEGKRLYELAREGITVEREAREIAIDRLDLRDFVPGEHPTATLEITCSSGTYIRTLAADLGAATKTGGMMRSLRRTWVGDREGQAFRLGEAFTLDALREREANGTLAQTVLPLTAALTSWPYFRLTDAHIARIRHGQFLPLEELAAGELSPLTLGETSYPVAILDKSDAFCAVGRVADGRLNPVKVFVHDDPV